MYQNQYIEIYSQIALTNAESRIMTIGAPNSGITIFEARDFNWYSFRIIASHNLDFIIDSTTDPTAAAFDNILTLPVAATIYNDNYNLAPPMSDHPYLAVYSPFMRITLTDTAAADHTYLRFYMKFWR